MRFVSVDIECNQPSGTIIQIGAVAWDTDRGEQDWFSVYVNPEEKINWDHMLSRGITLGELLPFGQNRINNYGTAPLKAVSMFWEFVKEVECSRRFLQWGGGDMEAIRKLSEMCGVAVPRYETVDAKLIYKHLYMPAMRLPKQAGLHKACGAVLGEFVGLPHSALWDARNTAKVYAEMFKTLNKAKRAEQIFKEGR